LPTPSQKSVPTNRYFIKFPLPWKLQSRYISIRNREALLLEIILGEADLLKMKMSPHENTKHFPTLAPGPPRMFAPQTSTAVSRPKKNSTACLACKQAKRKVSRCISGSLFFLSVSASPSCPRIQNKMANCCDLLDIVFWTRPPM
jgi:hypothetical protein